MTTRCVSKDTYTALQARSQANQRVRTAEELTSWGGNTRRNQRATGKPEKSGKQPSGPIPFGGIDTQERGEHSKDLMQAAFSQGGSSLITFLESVSHLLTLINDQLLTYWF